MQKFSYYCKKKKNLDFFLESLQPFLQQWGNGPNYIPQKAEWEGLPK